VELKNTLYLHSQIFFLIIRIVIIKVNEISNYIIEKKSPNLEVELPLGLVQQSTNVMRAGVVFLRFFPVQPPPIRL